MMNLADTVLPAPDSPLQGYHKTLITGMHITLMETSLVGEGEGDRRRQHTHIHTCMNTCMHAHTHTLVRAYKHINTWWDTCTYVRTYILGHAVSSQRANTMAARSRLVSTCTYVHTYVRTHQTLYSHSSTPEPPSGNSITHMQPHLPYLDNHLRRPHK